MPMNDIDLLSNQNLSKQGHIEAENKRRQRALVVELILRNVVHLQTVCQVSDSFAVSVAVCDQNYLQKMPLKLTVRRTKFCFSNKVLPCASISHFGAKFDFL